MNLSPHPIFENINDKRTYEKNKDEINKIDIEDLLEPILEDINNQHPYIKIFRLPLRIHNGRGVYIKRLAIRCHDDYFSVGLGIIDYKYFILLNEEDDDDEEVVYNFRGKELSTVIKYVLWIFYKEFSRCNGCGDIIKRGQKCEECKLVLIGNNIKGVKTDVCSICLDEVLNGYKTNCNHHFHYDCVYKLEKKKNNGVIYRSCPLCRNEIHFVKTELE